MPLIGRSVVRLGEICAETAGASEAIKAASNSVRSAGTDGQDATCFEKRMQTLPLPHQLTIIAERGTDRQVTAALAFYRGPALFRQEQRRIDHRLVERHAPVQVRAGDAAGGADLAD